MSIHVIRDLFQTSPGLEIEGAQKGFVEHCQDYADSAEGCRDVFDWLSHLSRTCEILSSSSEIGRVADRAKDLFETAGLGLSVPQLISDWGKVVHSISVLTSNHALSAARAVKDVVHSSLLFVNTTMRAVLFVNGAKVVSLAARQVVCVNVILSATALLTDGSDLIRDWLVWGVEGKRPEEDYQALMNVVKNASSVAVSALLMVAYTFGIALAEPIFAGSIFVLSSIYLTSKVSSYFYHKMVVEELNAYS